MNFGINGQPQTINVVLVDPALEMDEITGAQVTIPVVHHEVHEAEMFTVSLVALAVANNAAIEILLRVGATEYAHFTFFASCGGTAEIELVENPTVNVQGTAMVEFNNQRPSAHLAEVSAFHTPTVVGGTVILEGILPGGTGGNSAGGLLRNSTEFILKLNEDYVIRVTNRSGNAKAASIIAQWYEEDDI